jgi:hypothetical protein
MADDEIQPLEGEEYGLTYLVVYDEDQWNKYDDAGKQFCYDTWIKWATPIPGVEIVALKLDPPIDLFSDQPQRKAYIAWQHRLEKPDKPAEPKIAGRTLAEWQVFARQDNCLDCMVPSDLRELVGALIRAST